LILRWKSAFGIWNIHRTNIYLVPSERFMKKGRGYCRMKKRMRKTRLKREPKTIFFWVWNKNFEFYFSLIKSFENLLQDEFISISCQNVSIPPLLVWPFLLFLPSNQIFEIFWSGLRRWYFSRFPLRILIVRRILLRKTRDSRQISAIADFYDADIHVEQHFKLHKSL